MAHEKAYLVCEDMCLEEGMTKEEINKKLQYYTLRSNFAIFQGNILMENGQGTSNEIDLPTGFTSDNCIVLSAMFHGNTDTATKFSYGYLESSNSYVAGAIGHCITLTNSNKLKITIQNPMSSTSGNRIFEYKIVLMKLPNGNEATLLGDVNLDGQITEADINLVLNYSAGNTGLNFQQFANGDMNKDGELNSTDALLISQEIRE